MPVKTIHLQALIDIWSRATEPHSADLLNALRLAGRFESDPSCPVHLRAFGWHLVDSVHRAAGWDLPPDHSLAACRAAADSTTHATSLLVGEVAEEIRGRSDPVLMLGLCGASHRLFGRCDLFPAAGALLVSLGPDDHGLLSANGIPASRGIHWASPGRLREVYRTHSDPFPFINGNEVLVPDPPLILARTSRRPLEADDPGALVFMAAAYQVIAHNRWAKSLALARTLGHGSAPLEMVLRLGLEQWLGIRIGAVKRAVLSLRPRLHQAKK